MCVYLCFLVAETNALEIISRKSVVILVLSGMCAFTICSCILVNFE